MQSVNQCYQSGNSSTVIVHLGTAALLPIVYNIAECLNMWADLEVKHHINISVRQYKKFAKMNLKTWCLCEEKIDGNIQMSFNITYPACYKQQRAPYLYNSIFILATWWLFRRWHIHLKADFTIWMYKMLKEMSGYLVVSELDIQFVGICAKMWYLWQ